MRKKFIPQYDWKKRRGRGPTLMKRNTRKIKPSDSIAS
jgi:hypothetical protein